MKDFLHFLRNSFAATKPKTGNPLFILLKMIVVLVFVIILVGALKWLYIHLFPNNHIMLIEKQRFDFIQGLIAKRGLWHTRSNCRGNDIQAGIII